MCLRYDVLTNCMVTLARLANPVTAIWTDSPAFNPRERW
jgi:hypothetical protein